MDPEQATAAYQEAIDKALTVAREDAMILQSTTP